MRDRCGRQMEGKKRVVPGEICAERSERSNHHHEMMLNAHQKHTHPDRLFQVVQYLVFQTLHFCLFICEHGQKYHGDVFQLSVFPQLFQYLILCPRLYENGDGRD